MGTDMLDWPGILFSAIALLLLLAASYAVYRIVRNTLDAREAMAAIAGVKSVPRGKRQDGTPRKPRTPINVRWTRLGLPIWIPFHRTVTVAVKVKNAPHIKDLEQANDLAGRMLTVLDATEAEPPTIRHYMWRWKFTRP